MGASETLSGSSTLLQQAVTATYDNIVEKGFGREEENESDEKGVALANRLGYAPDRIERLPHSPQGPQQGLQGEARAVRLAPGDGFPAREHQEGDRVEEDGVHRDARRSLQEVHLPIRRSR